MVYAFGGTSTQDMPEIYLRLGANSKIGRKAYLAIDHESEDILDAVERQNPPLARLPHSLPIRMTFLDCRTDHADELRIRNSYLQVWVLLVSLEPVQVFSHNHLYHVYCGLMLANLRIKEYFETFAIMGTEGDWGSDIEVMEKVGNMKHNRVAGLQMVS